MSLVMRVGDVVVVVRVCLRLNLAASGCRPQQQHQQQQMTTIWLLEEEITAVGWGLVSLS